MRLPDPGNSRALLLGCGSYADPSLPDLPAIAGNCAGMKDILTSPPGIGLAPKHCVALEEADHVPAEIGSRLITLAAEAEDMLLVYYAGHGLIGPNGELFLALPGTRGDYDLVAWTALPFTLLRSALAESRARNRVLILDCCFSGRAIDVMTGVTSAVSGQLEIAGTCTLASSPANRPAVAQPGSEYTAYTGQFVHFLRNGSADQPELLTLTAIHQHLVRSLSVRGLPVPVQRNTETIGQLALARNRLWTPQAPVLDAGPQLPAPASLHTPPAPSTAQSSATAPWYRKRPILLSGGIAAVAATAILLASLLPDTSRPPADTRKVTVSNNVVTIGRGPAGIAVDSATHTAYVANYDENNVSTIDTTTKAVTGTIPVGHAPVAVAVDPASHTAYIVNAYHDTVSVINTTTNKVTATLTVGATPEAVAVDPGTHIAYVTNNGGNTVSVINTTTNKVTSITVGGNPVSVAVDPASHTAYVTNKGSTVSVINTTTNKVTATLTVTATLSASEDPFGIAIDPASHALYIADTVGGSVSVINAARNAIISIPVGKHPAAIAIDPATHTAYVTNANNISTNVTNDSGNTVSVINTTTNKVTATLTVGHGPGGIAIDPATHTAYVTNFYDNTVSVIKPG